ncbi:porin-like protein [Agrobacterium vitis]|nr:porin-like protein [Agrobacterium vitis]
MNIKAILLGSAAALAAVSGAQAADAIVAAAPEPAEYVRVCDAFGTGYFYIPGTETCLKISGYVRAQVDYSSRDGGRNWNAKTRGLVTFNAKNDSEIGTIGSTITVRAWQGGSTAGLNNAANDTNSVELDEAFITAGGFMVGSFYNYWDTGLSGETDALGSNRLNSIAYNYKSDTFFAGIAVDELNGFSGTDSSVSNTSAFVKSYNRDNSVGIEGQVGASFGPATVTLLGGYDFVAQEGAVRGIASVVAGPGTFSIAGVYASGVNAYYDASKWSVAAEYAAKITDKLTLTPGIQYFADTQVDARGNFGGRDITRAGLTVDYKIASGLTTKVSAQYQDKTATGASDVWTGFVRLQRSF